MMQCGRNGRIGRLVLGRVMVVYPLGADIALPQIKQISKPLVKTKTQLYEIFQITGNTKFAILNPAYRWPPKCPK